jgi:hypothetical protein
VGLGLTIAKMLAEKNGAQLILGNHPEGGLEARVILHQGVERTSPAPGRRRRGGPRPVTADMASQG